MPKGFTLIELIIYLAIIAIVLTASISFAWVLINDQIKLHAITELNDNAHFVMDKFVYHAKRAIEIDAQTVFDSNPGKLVLNYHTNPQITIDTYTKQITVGDQTVNITKLRLKHGADPAQDITSDEVNVTNFTITNLSNPNAKTIQVALNMEKVNPSSHKIYEAQNSWTISLTPRTR